MIDTVEKFYDTQFIMSEIFTLNNCGNIRANNIDQTPPAAASCTQESLRCCICFEEDQSKISLEEAYKIIDRIVVSSTSLGYS